jgi:hypothetical protein
MLALYILCLFNYAYHIYNPKNCIIFKHFTKKKRGAGGAGEIIQLTQVHSVGFPVSQLDYRFLVHYELPVENILGMQPVFPVVNTGSIPCRLRNAIPGACSDCGQVYVNL